MQTRSLRCTFRDGGADGAAGRRGGEDCVALRSVGMARPARAPESWFLKMPQQERGGACRGAEAGGLPGVRGQARLPSETRNRKQWRKLPLEPFWMRSRVLLTWVPAPRCPSVGHFLKGRVRKRAFCTPRTYRDALPEQMSLFHAGAQTTKQGAAPELSSEASLPAL